MYICCDKDESRPSAFSPWGVNSWLASSGGVLPLCRSWGLLEPHEGVYAVLSRPQRPWTAICVCCQARGTLCTNRLYWHHDSVPGVIQQTAQAANPWNQCALSLQQRYLFFSLHVCTDVGIFLVLWISVGTQAFFFFFFWTSGVLLSLQNFTLVLDESICNKETLWKQVVKVSERSYCDALLMVRFYLRVEAQSIHWFLASLHRDEPIYQLNTGPVDCQLIWWRLSVREVDFYLLHHPSFVLAECLKMMSQAGERFSFLNNQISLFFSVRKTGMNELNVDYRSRNFIVSPIPRFMQLD